MCTTRPGTSRATSSAGRIATSDDKVKAKKVPALIDGKPKAPTAPKAEGRLELGMLGAMTPAK